MFRKMFTIVGLIALASTALATGPSNVDSSLTGVNAEATPSLTESTLVIPLFVDPIDYIFATGNLCSSGCDEDRDCWSQAGGVAKGCPLGLINKCFWGTGSGCEGSCGCGWA